MQYLQHYEVHNMVSDKQFYTAFIQKFVQHLRDGENKDNPDDDQAADRALGDGE